MAIKKAKIFAGILLALFLGHLSDASLFPHSHFVGGKVIAHTHPHSDKEGSPQHEHCESQLVMIALLSMTVLAPALMALAAVLAVRRNDFFINLRDNFLERYETVHNYLRGPPATAFLF